MALAVAIAFGVGGGTSGAVTMASDATAKAPDAAATPAASPASPAANPNRTARAAAGHRAPPSPADEVNPLIGTANGGNTFPGAVVPFGMVQWSPETTRGDATRVAAPGGYAYDARRVRGFSLTHLSGTGCRGASGDIPFMPQVGPVDSSPSADSTDKVYTARFSHANEVATAGRYLVALESGIAVDLAATARTGAGRFIFPAGKPASLLLRVSDSEVGSSDAQVTVDPTSRTVTGSVTSGNFCGYLDAADRRSYYTLYFVAVFDRPFATAGTWENDALHPGTLTAHGGTTYGTEGYPVAGKGSGAWVGFDTGSGTDTRNSTPIVVNVRVGISYVSAANAAANLQAENPLGTSVDDVAARGRQAWDRELRRIEIRGGTADQRVTFYTALYHSLLHPNLFSDVNGQYTGFDGQTHTVAAPQQAQYANFSGWDVYRSQLQLVTLLEPDIASDIAQSLLNQATQNGGEWDRWTHNSGATHVMEGDPSPAAIASIVAFGGTRFDVKGAFASLARAADTPSPHDLSAEGCPIECVGQRPALDRWLSLHYIPSGANAWGGAGETLEDAIADFSLSQLAARLGDPQAAHRYLLRSAAWHNLLNPQADPTGPYIQDRKPDGTWPPFDPAADDGFAEGSSAQYTWMVPFDVQGLFDALGGNPQALHRLDTFFHRPDGTWALTGLGGTHAELDNEPSIAAPYLYLYAHRPAQTQSTVRQALNQLWSNRPDGIPGNDDLGEMSSWYVWSALGLYSPPPPPPPPPAPSSSWPLPSSPKRKSTAPTAPSSPSKPRKPPPTPPTSTTSSSTTTPSPTPGSPNPSSPPTTASTSTSPPPPTTPGAPAPKTPRRPSPPIRLGRGPRRACSCISRAMRWRPAVSP